jgi:translation initiation factor IF-2
MDKITVAELATECSVKNQIVLAELKRLGLYVFSPTATIDVNFAETIRKKILSQRDAEEAKVLEAEKRKEIEAAKLADKKPAKKAAQPAEKAAPPPPPAPVIKKAKKALKVEKVVEVVPEEPKVSLAPRKGRKHYDREAAELVDQVVKPAEKPPEEMPSEPVQEEALPAIPVEHELPAEAAPAAAEPSTEQLEAAPEAPAHPVQPHAPSIPEHPHVAVPAHEPAKTIETAAPASVPTPHVGHGTEPAGHPGVISKKIVIPKAKTKILMRTSTEKVVTPEVTDRILKGLAYQRPFTPRGPSSPPSRFIRKKRPDAPPERVAKVIELPRPPASPEDYKPIAITEGVTIKELAEKMDIKSKYIIQKLISRGILASINQALDVEAAREVCAEFGFRADVIRFEQEA